MDVMELMDSFIGKDFGRVSQLAWDDTQRRPPSLRGRAKITAWADRVANSFSVIDPGLDQNAGEAIGNRGSMKSLEFHAA
jgi:hypothetical protein